MHVAGAAGHAQHAVQQAALLGAGDRDVVVLEVDDRKLGQHRVAVVALRIHRVAAVGELRPDGVGQEFVVRRLRPVVDACAHGASCVPSTSCRNTTSAPTVRTASRSSGRMNLRLKAVKPLWVLTVMTLSEVGEAVTPAEGEESFT